MSGSSILRRVYLDLETDSQVIYPHMTPILCLEHSSGDEAWQPLCQELPVTGIPSSEAVSSQIGAQGREAVDAGHPEGVAWAVLQPHPSMLLPVEARPFWTALGSSLPPAPTGKEPVSATPSLTHRQTAPHPNQSSWPWLSLPDKNMAGISHGSHPILWVSHFAREGWLLIRAVVPLPGDSSTTLHSGTGGSLGELGMYNNHYGNIPLWSRVQASQSEAAF